MKIAIISDSHDNVANLEKIINWLNHNNITVLIHAGDLSAPGVLKNTLSLFKGQIHMIFGNVGDEETLKKVASEFSNVKYYGKKGEVEIDNKKIAIVHFKEQALEIAKEKKHDIIVFGHTHESEIQEINRIKLINPGTSGGLYNKATFIVYDTKTNEIERKEVDKL